MHKGFFAEMLRQRPLLLSAMLQANSACGDALPQVTVPAAVAKAAPSLCAWLNQGQRRWHAVVAPRSGERGAADGAGDAAHASDSASALAARLWDYAEESRRLCLVPAAALQTLASVVGVALHAGDIARVVDGEECRALKQYLGEALYRYALYRGQYAVGRVRELFAPLHPLLPLAQRCQLHGCMAVHCISQQWPAAYVVRFAALAPRVPKGERCPHFSEKDTYALWLVCKKLLLKEVLPSWAPCFD